MTSSNESSSGQLTATPKWLAILFLLFSAAGFADATYLAAKHYLGSPVTCNLLKGCEQVTSSQYATIFGVSVALLGAIFYLTIFLLSIIYLDTKKEKVFWLAAVVTPIGFLASLWFVHLQMFVIKALCLYCIVSAVTSTTLFILGLLRLNKYKPKKNIEQISQEKNPA